MSNKTPFFSDHDLRQIKDLFEDIKKNGGSIKIKDQAIDNFVSNAPNGDHFTSECWTLAVLCKLNELGYEIKKK